MYLFCALEDDMDFRAGCKTRRKVHGHMGILLESEGELPGATSCSVQLVGR